MSIHLPLSHRRREAPGRPLPATSELSVVTSTEEFLPHVAAYERLADQVDAAASMRWAALSPWLRHHPWAQPLIVLVHAGADLLGAAMLTHQPLRVGWRVAKTGVPGEPFALLAVDQATARALADAVLTVLEGRRWWLWLTDLPDLDPAIERLAAGVRRCQVTEAAETPVLDVSAAVDPRERPSRNTRQAAAKAVHRIAREGHRLTLTWTDTPAIVAQELPGLIELHVRRNEHLNRSAVLIDPGERDLFAETVLGHAAAGRVRLLTTRIDDELAAFALCLATGRRWWAYANYADPSWLRFSPGTLTNAEVVRAAHADPTVELLDWGSGIQRYKLSGGARLATRQTLDASSSGSVQVMRRLNRSLLRSTPASG